MVASFSDFVRTCSSILHAAAGWGVSGKVGKGTTEIARSDEY